MRKKITIKEVAKLAGVSVSTVSRTLNNGKYIKGKTKNKIIKVIKECEYRPNIIARGLRTKKTNSIGLIVPDITNEFFAKMALSIEKKLSEMNYNLLLCNSEENQEIERRYIKTLLDKLVDGIIFISSGYDENLSLFTENIPIVMIDRKISLNNIVFITSQNEEGGYLATKHLVENGCRKIIMLKDEKVVSTMISRFKGYKKALREYGLPFDPNLIIELEISREAVKEKILRIHNQIKFDGIFAGTDLLAIGAVKALIKLGYKIPDEVQIVGFDNIAAADFYNPGITTISQQIEKMGEKSAQIIVDIIEKKESIEPKSYYFPVKLIKRDTTK